MTVHIGCGLRQDCANEFVEGVEGFNEGGGAVSGFQMLGNMRELMLLLVQKREIV